LIDPAFIMAKKSLLQRFYDAYRKLEGHYAQFRFSSSLELALAR
jgi:hypothetical protein